HGDAGRQPDRACETTRAGHRRLAVHVGGRMKTYPIRDWVIGHLVAEKAALHGDRTFVQFEDRRLSYRELELLSNRIANGLMQVGVGKGTHVALMLDNKPEIILIYFALGKLGAVAVPLNTAAKGELL